MRVAVVVITMTAESTASAGGTVPNASDCGMDRDAARWWHWTL
jgi:hypothetical protein